MKKVKLNLDDLKVESFATTPDSLGGRGTVFGQDPTWATCEFQETCAPYNTCVGFTCADQTCSPGCEPSGGGTCGPVQTCFTCIGLGTCPDPTCGVTCGGGELTNCPGETNCGDPEPTWTSQGCTLCDNAC